MPTLNSRSVTASLLHLLRQGLTPEKLALTLALGVVLGCFPVFGTTTILCALVALAFRLNLPVIQVGNYLALPLQLLLLIPFMRLGERIFHAEKLSLAPQQLLVQAQSAPEQTMRILVAAQWHAIIAWLIVFPFATAILALLLLPLVRKVVTAANRQALVLPK